MTSPLAGSLAATIGGAFKGVFLDATLDRIERAAGPNDWTPGAGTPVTYPIKAVHDQWAAGLLAQGLVAADDVKLLILSASCPVKPRSGDQVTIRGEAFTIVPEGSGKGAVSTDPALAVWEIRAKR
jgi:hypothetical protein